MPHPSTPKIAEDIGRYLTEKLTGCCHEPEARVGAPFSTAAASNVSTTRVSSGPPAT